MAKPKRPRDVNQLAKLIVDIATGNAPADPEPKKNPAAVALGKLGGAKGGPARAKKGNDLLGSPDLSAGP